MPGGYRNPSGGELGPQAREILQTRKRLRELEKFGGSARSSLTESVSTAPEGLPPGGWGGWVARRRADGSGVLWGPELMGAEPAAEIYLGGNSADFTPDNPRSYWYEQVVGYGWGIADGDPEQYDAFTVAQRMMPPIDVDENGSWCVLMGTGWRTDPDASYAETWANAGAARFTIWLDPRFDGEVFEISMPLSTNRNFGTHSPWSHLDLAVYNNSNSGFKARVVFWYLAGVYAGTRIAPGEWWSDPGGGTFPDGDARFLDLVADEWLEWRVENPGGGATAEPTTTVIHPVNRGIVPPGYDNNAIQQFSGATGDRWWERYVMARQHTLPFSWMGDLEVAGGEHEWVNFDLALRAIGLIAATATTPSESGDILVDIRIDGVSILASPLVIPEGEKRGTAVPAPSRWPLGSKGPFTFDGPLGQIELAKWDSGSALTAHVVDPGTGAANLTIQVYYG